MERPMIARPQTLAAVLGAGPSLALAPVNHCTDADGSMAYAVMNHDGGIRVAEYWPPDSAGPRERAPWVVLAACESGRAVVVSGLLDGDMARFVHDRMVGFVMDDQRRTLADVAAELRSDGADARLGTVRRDHCLCTIL
jgi:hypothetical protein